MRIKEAAAHCRLTEKAIRLYEEKGLITPNITEINGRKFRDYDEETVRTLEVIAGLRQSFFSLEQIAAMQDEPERIPEIFIGYRTELHDQYDKLASLIARADALEPTAITSPKALADALASDSDDALTTPDGTSILTEEAQTRPTPPIPDYRFRIWDEDIKCDERERAYEKYLRSHSRWELFYDAEVIFLTFWEKSWKWLVFAGIPLFIFVCYVCTMPRITEVDLTLSGYEIHYEQDSVQGIYPEPYEAPVYSEPRTLNLKGKLYRYLFKPDYYEGEVNIDGFVPYTYAHNRGKYTLEEELMYFNNFKIFFEDPAKSVFGHILIGEKRQTQLQRIGTRDEIGPVYATKSLDRFAFKIYSDGQWLVFPASGAGEASQLYWTWIWESWQNPE